MRPFFSGSAGFTGHGCSSVRPGAVFGKSPSHLSLDHLWSQVSDWLGGTVVQDLQGWEHKAGDGGSCRKAGQTQRTYSAIMLFFFPQNFSIAATTAFFFLGHMPGSPRPRTVVLIWRLIWRDTMTHGFLKGLCFLGQNTPSSNTRSFGGVQH